MKKLGVLLLLLVISLFSILVQAQDASLPPEVEKIQDVGESFSSAGKNLTDEELRDEYLKQEWSKILEKSNAGRFLLAISNVFSILSPVFKLLIGMEYELSWLFFLSLGVWIAIVIIIYKPVRNFLQVSNWVAFGISVIIPTIGAQFGTLQIFVSFFTPLFKNLWSTITTIIVIAILIYAYAAVIDHFGKSAKESLKKEREQRREHKAKTVEKIHDIIIKAHK